MDSADSRKGDGAPIDASEGRDNGSWEWVAFVVSPLVLSSLLRSLWRAEGVLLLVLAAIVLTAWLVGFSPSGWHRRAMATKGR